MFHKAKLDVKTHHFCQRVFLFPDLISCIYFPPKVNSLLTSPGQVCSAMAKLGALEYSFNYYYHYQKHSKIAKNTHKNKKIVTFQRLRCSAIPQEERPR